MACGERTKVMIVDDHEIVRVGLKEVLEGTGEFVVVGQAVDGVEAVRVAAEASPDLVVMDVMMPNKDGVEACREIMESHHHVRVVMLTASTEEDAVVEAVAAGATGYLQKDSGRDKLLTTIREVVNGELRVPASVVTRVFAGIRAGVRSGNPAGADTLTRREREILISFARGFSYAQIAQERGIKPVTARNAIYGIQSKLRLGTMQELVLWIARNGLLDD